MRHVHDITKLVVSTSGAPSACRVVMISHVLRHEAFSIYVVLYVVFCNAARVSGFYWLFKACCMHFCSAFVPRSWCGVQVCQKLVLSSQVTRCAFNQTRRRCTEQLLVVADRLSPYSKLISPNLGIAHICLIGFGISTQLVFRACKQVDGTGWLLSAALACHGIVNSSPDICFRCGP